MKYVLTLLFLLCLSLHARATQELLIGYPSEHIFPHAIGDGDKVRWPRPGLGVEFFKLIEKKLDVKFVFKRYPIKRMRTIEMKEGVVDGTFTVSYSPQRAKDWASYPMFNGQVDSRKRMSTLRYVLYKNKHSKLAWNGQQFSHLNGPIGVPLGWSIAKNLKDQGVSVVELKDNLTLFDVLMRRRIAGAITLETTGSPIIEKNARFSGIEKVQPAIKEKHYYLVLSHQFVKQNPQMAEKIWTATAAIRESNEYAALVKAYDALPPNYGQ